MASNISQLLQLKISVDGAAKAKSEVSSLGSTVTNLGKQLLAPIAGIATIAKAFQFFGKAMKEAESSDMAQKKVANAIEATGHSAKLTAEELSNAASELQNMSNVDDDDILSGLTATLLTFREIQGDVFKRAQQDILDMSQFLSSDLQGSAIQVGKALNDPIKGVAALSKAGVSFTESQKSTIASMVSTNNIAGAQNIILTELEHEFGNAAAAAMTAGDQMKNAFGGLLEEIGGVGNKFANPMKVALTEMLKIWTEELSGMKKDSSKALEDFKIDVATKFIAIISFFDLLLTSIPKFIDTITGLLIAIPRAVYDAMYWTIDNVRALFVGLIDVARNFNKSFVGILLNGNNVSESVSNFTKSIGKSFNFTPIANMLAKDTKLAFSYVAESATEPFKRFEKNYEDAFWNAKKKIHLMSTLKTGAPMAPTDNSDAAGDAADQIDIIAAQIDMIKALGADYQAFYNLRSQQIKTEHDAYIAANIDKNLADTWYISELGKLSKEWENFDINKKNAEAAKKAADEINASVEAEKKAYDDQLSAFKANRDKISTFLLENGTSYRDYLNLRKQQLNDEYNDYLNAGASILDAEEWKQKELLKIERDWEDKRVSQYTGFNKLFADALTSLNQSLELGLQNSFYSIISSTNSFSDAMKNLWSSLKMAILQEISAIIAKMLVLKATQALIVNSNPISAIIGGFGSLFGGGSSNIGGLGGTDLIGSQTASVGKSNSFMNQIGNAQIFDSLQNSINRLSKAIENQQQPQINVYPVGGVKLYDVVRKAQLQANAL